MKYLPYILIAVVFFLAAGFYIDANDKRMPLLQTQSPSNTNKPANSKLKNYGQAPDFTGINNWINSVPLTMAGLKGKVVLIDFWTYSCINCIRTLPYVTSWYEKYKDQGLVIVGVHTPEFEFEKVTENVQTAIKRHNINYPVAQDNNFATWRAYQNRYWPAKYLIDREGNIVYKHFGEGEYDVTEANIRKLLEINEPSVSNSIEIETQKGSVKTPEIYFGTSRLEHLAPSQRPQPQPTNYTLPAQLKLNEFALEGEWQFTDEKIKLISKQGSIKLKFFAGNVFMVATSDKPVQFSVTVDGEHWTSGDILASQLYKIVESVSYGEHIMEIVFYDTGVEIFTFTFG